MVELNPGFPMLLEELLVAPVPSCPTEILYRDAIVYEKLLL
jgi:hypothetical protein